MRKVLILTVLLAGPALAQPPRQQSPAPREMLESLGSGNSDEAIAAHLDAAAIDAALDPAGYLGSAEALVQRALDFYRKEGLA